MTNNEITTFEDALAIIDRLKLEPFQSEFILSDFMVFCRAGASVKDAFVKAVQLELDRARNGD